MKKIIALAISLFALLSYSDAQTVSHNAATRTTTLTTKTFRYEDYKRLTTVDTCTTYEFEIKGKAYPVFKSKNGAYYIWRVSGKTGKNYRMYLPKEVQQAMGREYKN